MKLSVKAPQKMKMINRKLQSGDMVKRMIATHYTNHQISDALGVVLAAHYPLAKVYFYDTNREESWNQNALELVSRKGDE